MLGTNTSAGTAQGASEGIASLMGGVQSGIKALKTYSGQADQALTTNQQAGLGALNSGYSSAINALQTGGNQAQGLVSQGTNQGVLSSLLANNTLQPTATAGAGASGMLSNALGLNGPSGNAAATAAFQASPGYQFQQQQAADTTSRQAAALGMAGSGNTLQAILNGSSNLANTEYNNYLGNLTNLGNQGLNASSLLSTNDRAAGTIQASGGQTAGSLANTNATSQGTAYTGQGSNAATLYSNLGSGLSNNLTGLGQGISANNMNEAAEAANLQYNAGAAQDQAANVNSGILSKLIGGVVGLPLGSTSLSGSSSSSSGSGLLNSLLSGVGNTVGNATIGTNSVGLPNMGY